MIVKNLFIYRGSGNFYVALISLLLVFLTENLQAQEKNKVDSLLHVLESSKLTGNAQVDFVIKIGKALYYESTDIAIKVGKEAISLSENNNYKSGLAEGNFLLARSYTTLNDSIRSKYHFDEAEKLFLSIKASSRLGSLYNNIGIIYMESGQFQNALKYFILSRDHYILVKDKHGEGVALNHIGIVYFRTTYYEKATEAYFEAIKRKEETNDDYGIALINANLGNLFVKQGDFEKSLNYFMDAEQVFTEKQDLLNLAKVHYGLGTSYTGLKNNMKALTYLRKGLEHFKSDSNKFEIANGLIDMGRLYLSMEEYHMALASYKEALHNFEMIGNKDGEAKALTYMGEANVKLKNNEEAKQLLYEGLNAAKEVGEKQTQLVALRGLHELYDGMGDIQLGHEYYVQYTNLKETIYNLEKSRQIDMLEKQFNVEQQQKENQFLLEERKVQQALLAKKNFELKVLIIAIILFSLFGLYFYRVYSHRKKTTELLFSRNEEINKKQAQIISINESLKKSQIQLNDANKELQKLNIGLESTIKERTAALENLNKELDTFLYQSSHALRRPVVSVMGLTQLARMEEAEGNQGLHQLYDKIDDTLVRMDLMLKKLVMASEINFIDLERDMIDFEEIVSGIRAHLEKKLKISNLQFDCQVSLQNKYFGDLRLIMVIFQNLIENAMLYHHDGLNRLPSIQVVIQQNDKGLGIKIHDNGMGISTKVISSIFNMFTVGNDKAQGYGLGLYLVKKAVEKLKGTIQVTSKSKEFTTFFIDIPDDGQFSKSTHNLEVVSIS